MAASTEAHQVGAIPLQHPVTIRHLYVVHLSSGGYLSHLLAVITQWVSSELQGLDPVTPFARV